MSSGLTGRFFARFLEAEDEFAAVEGFVAAVAFNGAEVFPLNLFVGGEAVVTGEALPTATDNGTVLPRA